LILLVVLTACAPNSGSGQPAIDSRRRAPGGEGRSSRTLNSVIRVEPASLASKPLVATGISVAHVVRLFNAELDLQDGQERALPYLAEALPQLNTESWRVLPDGRMETSYTLREGTVWHDGAPLTAEDFVFGFRVFKTPELGQASTTPIRQIEEVSALDDRRLVIHWNSLFPDAAALGKDFHALPRHILAQSFETMDAPAFGNHPYWTNEFVGLGPYKLDRWEPGAFIQAAAFDRHVLGKPKIDRVVVRFIADENTVLSNLLAGEVQFATDRTVRFEQAQVLKREWGTTGGTPILSPVQPRSSVVQMKPEYANPAAILDVRVRRALAHAISRDALNEGLFNGEGVMSDTLISSRAPYYAELERTIAHYPYDPRRSEQLMNEAGFTKDRDGFFARAGERFIPTVRQDAGVQTERELGILMDTWRGAGFDIQAQVMSSTQLRDIEYRSTFPTLIGNATNAAVQNAERSLQNWTTAQAGNPANRWRGNNYGGWSNGEYDALWEAYNTTLDRAERNRQMIQMARVVSEQLPLYNLFWNFNVTAHSATLRGPDPNAIDVLVNWNVHEWEMT
jgi:peptide/nickel transport system substrate-binding protein